ncbi:hypothetical protein LSAT2_029886 [Lamellibrachia satsuma]|nr:hypothetical protein LSAT2_029886 [Lamellibrachia satsuma]
MPIFTSRILRQIFSLRHYETGNYVGWTIHECFFCRLLSVVLKIKKTSNCDLVKGPEPLPSPASLSTTDWASEEIYDDEAVHLARAAQIVRRDILKITSKFSESFDEACPYDSVAESRHALMTMILQGPSMKAVNYAKQPAALSLSQLIGLNCVKSIKASDCRSTRHFKERETPL